MREARSGEGADEWGLCAPVSMVEEARREAGHEVAVLMGVGDGSTLEEALRAGGRPCDRRPWPS